MSERCKLLIVEDNRALALALSAAGERCGFEVEAVPSLALARRSMVGGVPRAVLLDLGLPDGRGLDLLEDFDEDAMPAVAMLTAHGEIEHAIAAKKAGVAEFFVKPVDFGELEGFLRKVFELGRGGDGDYGGVFVGRSEAMRRVFREVGEACASERPVVVRGPSGSGRSHVAHLIHTSDGGGGKCVVVDCGEFEGGWDAVVSEAAGGSVVLDGVERLRLETQVLLEEAMVASEGVRWIAIARGDGLRGAVGEHAFHPDLYYRLQGCEVVLPGLEERAEDFEGLCEVFLEGTGVSVGSEVMEALKRREWAGNLRELRSFLREMIEKMGVGGVIGIDDLPAHFVTDEGGREGFDGTLERWLESWFEEGNPEYREIQESLEGKVLEILLERFGGNQAAMARSLEMNRATLRKRLRKS